SPGPDLLEQLLPSGVRQRDDQRATVGVAALATDQALAFETGKQPRQRLGLQTFFSRELRGEQWAQAVERTENGEARERPSAGSADRAQPPAQGQYRAQ